MGIALRRVLCVVVWQVIVRRAVNTVETSIQARGVQMTKNSPDLFCYNVEKLSGLMFARIDQVGCRVGESQLSSARGDSRGKGRDRA